MPERKAVIERKTRETDVVVKLELDGKGEAEVETGIPFFDHMLTALAKHALLDLKVKALGDLEVDGHHTVEDAGICLGRALNKALGEKAGINRFGFARAPMDEALAEVSMDLSGRGVLVYEAAFSRERVGDLDLELVEEFFNALAGNACMALHVTLIRGKNAHHCVEALFKALALALRQAVAINSHSQGVPSTKGEL